MTDASFIDRVVEGAEREALQQATDVPVAVRLIKDNALRQLLETGEAMWRALYQRRQPTELEMKRMNEWRSLLASLAGETE